MTAPQNLAAPNSIALGVPANLPAPAPAGGNAAPKAAATPAPSQPVLHQVAEGETLDGLAQKYGIHPQTILNANHISDPNNLVVGQRLVIPPVDGVLYQIQKGDSIRAVAQKFGVQIGTILKANNVGSNPDLVAAGTQLVIPGATPLPVVHAAPAASEQQAASAGSAKPVAAAAPAAASVPQTRKYQVQTGDTLNSIAQKFGVDVSTILSSNGISNPDTIHPGSELTILPVKGVQYTVQPNETLADIAWRYQVDLGLLLDYNNLSNPDVLHPGQKLVLPGGQLRADTSKAPVFHIAAPQATAAEAPKPAAVVAHAVSNAPAIAAPHPAVAAPAKTAPAPAPAKATPAPTPAPKPIVAPAKPAPPAPGGGGIVATAMKYVGYPYVWGGTSPSGFDCSGFVYYVMRVTGHPMGRGMWEEYNSGPHIPESQLQPGDIVFFANTYMPGLSHVGIYIGGGRFVHAADEQTGVTVSSLGSAYWTSHYAGATRPS